jgi:enoyl-CoA hydratase/carnithine racemase
MASLLFGARVVGQSVRLCTSIRWGRSNFAASFSRFTSQTQQKAVWLDEVENVAVVRLDDPTSKVNTLNEEFTRQFTEAFEKFEANTSYKAMVLISNKKDNFIAGADINQLAACNTSEALVEVKVSFSHFGSFHSSF